MARAIKLIEAPIGLFEVDGILVLKTQYCTRNEDGTVTADCYIVESGEYFWGGVDNAEERNNLMVMPVDMPIPTPPNEWVSVEERLPTDERPVLVFVGYADTMTGFITTSSYFCFDANPHWQWDGLVRDEQRTLFWMPLPAPPGKDNNVPAKTPNEPLTQEDIDKMHFDRVWIDYGLDDSGERCGEDGVILYGKLYSIDTLDGSAFEDLLLDACDGETLGRPSGDYTVYRRPPEVQS